MGKDFFASKQSWGAIVLLIMPVLHKLGINVDSSALVDTLVQISGGVLFLWGAFSKSRAPVTSVAGIKTSKSS